MMKDKIISAIIQLATPYSVGTGFILEDERVIITSEHIIRDNKEVIIYGKGFKQQMVEVLFVDEKYDLAFLAFPENFEGKGLIGFSSVLKEGDLVYGVGHPYGSAFLLESGVITDLNMVEYGIDFINHTINLPVGFSGGPLLSTDGLVLGINTFLDTGSDIKGFTLPLKYLVEKIKLYREANRKIASVCSNCSSIVSEDSILNKKYCSQCGDPVVLPSSLAPYEPSGVALRIEQLLERMSHNALLARRGVNNWGIDKGSAHINISYYEKIGLIIGDSYLCRLPEKPSSELYEFLLKQNYILDGLTLSIKGRDIVLSLLIYDRYLNVNTGVKQFEFLFQKADDLDNILVEKYGATWIEEHSIIHLEKTT